MRRLIGAALGTLLLLWAPLGLAAWDDFDGFARALRGHAATVVRHRVMTLADVPAGAGLALLAADVEAPAALRAWVQDGARLLILAEADLVPAVLAAFELRLGPAPTGPRLGDHPALIEVPPTHRGLLAGLEPVITNHPTGLAAVGDLQPTARFADGTAFAFSLRLGAGEVIVLADSSVALDLMSSVGGNTALVARLARWLAADGRPVHLVSERLTGGRADAPRSPASSHLNRALARLRARAPDRLALAALAAALSAGLFVFILFVFPGRGRRRPPAAPPADDVIAGRAAAPGGPSDPHAPDAGETP